MSITGNVKALFKRGINKREVINNSVRDAVAHPGFQIIEQHIKKCIETRYKDLLSCNKEKLPELQIEISYAIDLMKTIYSMAGLVWKYDEVIDPVRIVDEDELSEYEKALEEEKEHINKMYERKQTKEMIHG